MNPKSYPTALLENDAGSLGGLHPRGVGAGPFAINGLVSLQRLKHPEWLEAYKELAPSANRLLSLYPQWGRGYPWPVDPLHCWYRPFEYPYVLHNLPPVTSERRPIVLDVGSAVTFFGLLLARRGYILKSTDCDPRMLTFWRLVKQRFPEEVEALSRWEYRISEPYAIPIPTAEADAVTCISVLEHVEDPPRLLHEMLRILKPGGTLILTMDISLELNIGVSVEHFHRLQEILGRCCLSVHPVEPVHPQDLLVWPASPEGLVPAPWFPKKEQGWIARARKAIALYRAPRTPDRSTCLFVATYRRGSGDSAEIQ